MKYRVHIYASMRLAVDVEAASKEQAIKLAQEQTDLDRELRTGEYADEITGFLVDEEGDVEYLNTTSHDADGKIITPESWPMTTETLTTTPGTMDRPLHRDDYKNGQLTVVFTDAAHLADAWNFADKHGKTAEFERGLLRLVRMALGSAVPSRAFQHPSYRDDGAMIDYPAQPGQEAKITIHPDNHRTPSFLFQEQPGLVGGLIFHSYDASWSIHT